ncbi:MAG: hypothetical protein KAI73_02515, partial [Rhodospirillaceae bacterium]|nr:hypothetical protein [Rhodospirillaceae bacterium]
KRIMLLSVDPGLRKIGWALWADGLLFATGLAATKGTRDRDARQWLRMAAALHTALGHATHPGVVTCVAYEMPQVYDAASTKRLRKTTGRKLTTAVNPDNLMQLVGVLGAVLVPFEHANLIAYRPRQWKAPGTTKGETQRMVNSTLSPVEHRILGPALTAAGSCAHDVIDAVGIGLRRLRRGGCP